MSQPTHSNALPPEQELLWYRVERVLGQGGFGITYLARDVNLNQDVAIKEFLPSGIALRAPDFTVQPLSAPQAEEYRWGLERFLTEARTLARFDHPNIVRVFTVFEANGTAYMVMRYEQGRTLHEILEERGSLGEAELRAILLPVLDGLKTVHAAGFIHRDIKPANIFLRADGQPVLIDFGSARQALGQLTQTLTTIVSPGYAPFEQYYSDGGPQGPWTDLYALGATAYRAIAGVSPMAAVDRSKAILRGLGDMFVQAAELGEGRYSLSFLRAIDHALAFREEDRPQSVDAWLEELRAGSAPEPAPAAAAVPTRQGSGTVRLDGPPEPADATLRLDRPQAAGLPVPVQVPALAAVSPLPAVIEPASAAPRRRPGPAVLLLLLAAGAAAAGAYLHARRGSTATSAPATMTGPAPAAATPPAPTAPPTAAGETTAAPAAKAAATPTQTAAVPPAAPNVQKAEPAAARAASPTSAASTAASPPAQAPAQGSSKITPVDASTPALPWLRQGAGSSGTLPWEAGPGLPGAAAEKAARARARAARKARRALEKAARKRRY